MTPFERLARLEPFGIKFGLENIRVLTTRLGHPERAFRSILVAGTNGKGSVVAMVDAGIRAAGHRAGRYTSPHLIRLSERVVVDGEPVSETLLSRALERVLDVEADCRRTGALETPATHFEVVTATALDVFRTEGVAVATIEVGLGGRFDATNVVRAEICAITTIDFDHTGYLGGTLAEIAREKAGIVKPESVVVIGERKREARAVIEDACRREGATPIAAHDGVRVSVAFAEGETDLRLATPSHDYGEVRLALRGAHQVDNAVVAVRVLEALDERGIAVPPPSIVRGLERVSWPGRLQRLALDAGRTLVLDGAHNPAGAQALAAWLRAAVPERRLPIVFGVMSDKDARSMLQSLAPVASALIATEVPLPRAMRAEELVAIARDVMPGIPVEGVVPAEAAVARALAERPIACVAGSLFLVGAVLEAFERGRLT
jgi:dihydrofolate synthase / folylpolyglutamate synthase